MKEMTEKEIQEALQKCREIGINISGIPSNAEITNIEFLDDETADEKGQKYARITYKPRKENE